jgi:hypothetical protein
MNNRSNFGWEKGQGKNGTVSHDEINWD